MSDDTSPRAGNELARPEILPPASTNWSGDINSVAERLAMALAEQLGQITARRKPLDEARIRAYEVTRLQLAGPSDDEADTLGLGTIVSVTPHAVTRGDSKAAAVAIVFRNVDRVDEIIFAGPDGGEVVERVDPQTAGPIRGCLTTTVGVPKEAVSGALSAATDAGILTFRKPFVIHDPQETSR